MAEFPLKASVCICTFNGASRVGLVIEALIAQTEPLERWELLVIDNASTDGTGPLCAGLFQKFPGPFGRVIREERPGLSFARDCAARAARGEIICFLDDDNIPERDFVAAAIQAFDERPKAGVVGGKILPRWEAKPTPLALAVASFALAICEHSGAPRRYVGVGEGIVGAGLCVRTGVLRQIYEKQQTVAQVSGRKGSSLMSGEDLVISVMARQLGWETWNVPTLQVQHLLPAGRMDPAYLRRLYEGIGRGQAATRQCFDWKARSPLAWLIGCKDYGRWLLGRWRGPGAALRREQPELAGELHELHQRLTWGRAWQALAWPR